jgi:ATP synthase protein I
MPKLKKEFLRLLVAVSSLGIELGVSIFIGYLIGNYLDGYFGTGSKLTIIFILFGMAAGFRSFYRLSRDVTKDLHNGKYNDIFEEEDKGNDKEKK